MPDYAMQLTMYQIDAFAEDPVTGSAYTQLAPYWAHRLQKTTMHARQLSRRGGNVTCHLNGNRVQITGSALLYLEGVVCL